MSPPKFLETENAISRREPNEHSGYGGGGGGGGSYPPPSVKIHKDSHLIKKPLSPPSSSVAAAAAAAAKPRHPVIIYTHSPKVIHTNPKDFMALVQKLTGMSRSDEDQAAAGDRRGKPAANRVVSGTGGEDNKSNNNSNNNNRNHGYNNNNNSYNNNRGYTGNRKGIFVNNAMFSEDSESSSVITTEETIGEQGQVNSFPAVPPPPYPSPAMFEAPSPAGFSYGAYLSSIPIFAANPADGFLCANQTLGNFEMDPLFFAHNNMRSSFSSSSSSGFDGLTEFRDF